MALSFVLVAGSAGIATPGDQTDHVVAPTDSGLAQLLRLADAAHLAPMLDGLLAEHQEPAAQAATMVEAARALSDNYASADTPQDVILKTAAMKAIDVDRRPVPLGTESVDLAILEMYGLLGVAPTSAEAVQLSTDLQRLDTDSRMGLSILVETINEGLLLQQAGTVQAHLETALLFLDAADAVEGMFTSSAQGEDAGSPPAATGTSSVACSEVFEDPLFLIRVGSDCDDVVSETARVLVYDPAGDDVYHHNAGGAHATRFVTTMPSWLSNPAARLWVPIALHVDESGVDTYETLVPHSQGAGGTHSVGVLLDQGGNDTYVCGVNCQGFGNIGGVGVFVDQHGNDSYMAQRDAQASGSAAFLIEWEGNDSFLAESGAQAGQSDFLLPSALGALLLDRSGDDVYEAADRSQGVGNRLVDLDGNDTYTALGIITQGAGIARSHGFLVDRIGNDVYIGGTVSQGAGAVAAAGVLADFEGDDIYSAGDESQGSAQDALATGILYDETGRDEYTAGQRSQGSASNRLGGIGTLGALIDRDGDDVYAAGGQSQGASAAVDAGTALGILLDGDGDDDYLSTGDGSQGASTQGGGEGEHGAGVLVDAGGQDDYSAGTRSQGSGTGGGIGLLVDDTRQGEGPRAFPDSYTAGNSSQGSGAGGVGILLDTGDRQQGKKSEFVAGSNSQGSASGGGAGILVNHDGQARSSYTADGFSQGSSTGGLGLLLDRAGKDRYQASDPPTSQGFGESTYLAGHVAVGVIVDFDGRDGYDDFGGNPGNTRCVGKGDIGLLVDMNLAEPADLPEGCIEAVQLAVGVAAAGLENETVSFVNQLLADIDQAVKDAQDTVNETIEGALNETEPDAPANPIFHDDFESGAPGWTVAGNDPLAAEWRLENENEQPQASPNARSGEHYWYAGLPGGGAYASNADVTLTSPAIDLTTATSANFSAWVAGSSEQGFDQLTISAYEVGNPSNSAVLAVQDGGRTGVVLIGVGGSNPLPEYEEVVASLDEFLGTSVHLEFRFVSDFIYEDGQGWNVDDVSVA